MKLAYKTSLESEIENLENLLQIYTLENKILDNEYQRMNPSNHTLYSRPDLKLVHEYLSTNQIKTGLANKKNNQNPNHPENLTRETVNGITVRSKSEDLIALTLKDYGIDFRYESKLNLGGTIFFPDFTLLHPVTGEIIYWEHFGMMDDVSYANKAIAKIENYSKHGISIGNNLLVTFETQEHQIDRSTIVRQIELLF